MHVLNILWVVFGIGLMLVLTMTAGSDTFPTLAMSCDFFIDKQKSRQ
ncbi:hypothetical protein G842_00618 [Escherichia coli HVH 190 (4-3255514)]|nr:hypothetical protein G842_00618 [Escherichia coli HVH 190 (4-3255514)]EQX06253.1 hypothetical protein G921_02638 [Escherichia coli UMEA 3155-1]GDB60047.1 fructuronate transporter [Escherichia coli]